MPVQDEPRSCAFKQKVFEKVNPFCFLFTTEIKQPDDAIPRNFQKNPVTPLCRCRSFSGWEAVGDAGSLQDWQTHRAKAARRRWLCCAFVKASFTMSVFRDWERFCIVAWQMSRLRAGKAIIADGSRASGRRLSSQPFALPPTPSPHQPARLPSCCLGSTIALSLQLTALSKAVPVCIHSLLF